MKHKGIEQQLNKIKEWLSFSLDNQLGLQSENENVGFPEWNKGYLEALRDLEKIVNDNQ